MFGIVITTNARLAATAKLERRQAFQLGRALGYQEGSNDRLLFILGKPQALDKAEVMDESDGMGAEKR